MVKQKENLEGLGHLGDFPSDKKLTDILDALVNQTYQILTWKMIAATTPVQVEEPENLPQGYYSFKHEDLNKIVEIVQPLLASVQQAKKIKVDSVKDITDALKRGKISISEAKELLNLINAKNDIEDGGF